jgi:hypothetical protein
MGMVVHVYNHSYLADGDWKEHGLKPSPSKTTSQQISLIW